MTPDEYIAAILSDQRLEEDSPELDRLRQTKKAVDTLLRMRYGNRPTIRYGGSKAKNTMIREAYDLDMICYFARDDTQAGSTIEDIYHHVAGVLETNYFVQRKRSALRLTSKERSTSKTDLHVDVVPGRYIDGQDGDVFLHQNEGDKHYLKTNLNVHIAHIKGSGVTDAIKLLKLWNVRNSIGVKTFVLELLVVDLLRHYKRASLSQQFLTVIHAFRDHIDSLAVEDPANPIGNDLSDILNSARPFLQSRAEYTLTLISRSEWEAVFGPPTTVSAPGKVELLMRAAAAVHTATKPWWTPA
jgi:hypothetical protein